MNPLVLSVRILSLINYVCHGHSRVAVVEGTAWCLLSSLMEEPDLTSASLYLPASWES